MCPFLPVPPKKPQINPRQSRFCLSCWFLLPHENKSIKAGVFLELHYSHGKDSRHTAPLKLHFWKLPVAEQSPWSWESVGVGWALLAPSALPSARLLQALSIFQFIFLNELPQDMSLALAFCMGFCASLS